MTASGLVSRVSPVQTALRNCTRDEGGLAEDDPDTKARLFGFRQALEKLGWVEGHNVRIDYRFAPAGARAQVLAKELVALRPDVILSNASPATGVAARDQRDPDRVHRRGRP